MVLGQTEHDVERCTFAFIHDDIFAEVRAQNSKSIRP
jgi:hypothetical protein